MARPYTNGERMRMCEELMRRGAACSVQKRVVSDAVSQRCGVVAQLSDLGRHLEHEAEPAIHRPDRSVREQFVGVAPRIDLGHDGRIVQVESVVADQEVKTCRIPTADLHAVERRQRLMDREDGIDRCASDVVPAEVENDLGGAETVTFDRPQRVSNPDQRRVHRFEIERVRGGAGVELGFERVEAPSEVAQRSANDVGSAALGDEETHAGGSP